MPEDIFRYTIAVDFDGVIHDYSEGWKDGTIYGEPVSGAFEALRELMEDYNVFIFTSRDAIQIAEWMTGHGFKVSTDDSMFEFGSKWSGNYWDTPGVLLITSRKLGAKAYIDDRGIRFQSWGQALADLERL